MNEEKTVDNPKDDLIILKTSNDAKPTIDPTRVEEIFMDCLFKEGENSDNHVKVEGIQGAFGFHPDRLESHRKEVQEMLMELPENFRSDSGGGWTFLNACNDKHGNQWSGFHQRMDQLFVLGIGLGIAVYQLEREMWSAFPGGVPYVTILVEEFKELNNE